MKIVDDLNNVQTFVFECIHVVAAGVRCGLRGLHDARIDTRRPVSRDTGPHPLKARTFALAAQRLSNTCVWRREPLRSRDCESSHLRPRGGC